VDRRERSPRGTGHGPSPEIADQSENLCQRGPGIEAAGDPVITPCRRALRRTW
jgi:hypothetical protein